MDNPYSTVLYKKAFGSYNFCVVIFTCGKLDSNSDCADVALGALLGEGACLFNSSCSPMEQTPPRVEQTPP